MYLCISAFCHSFSREKKLDPLNTHEKKIRTQWKPTRKNFGLTKYPQRHDGMMALDPQELPSFFESLEPTFLNGTVK